MLVRGGLGVTCAPPSQAKGLRPRTRLRHQRRLRSPGTGQPAVFQRMVRRTVIISTVYLHNHERMWFASIGIFTLSVPWELGARFFPNHTRWRPGGQYPLVALGGRSAHRGENDVTRADNIAEDTGDRWVPSLARSTNRPRHCPTKVSLTRRRNSRPSARRPRRSGRTQSCCMTKTATPSRHLMRTSRRALCRDLPPAACALGFGHRVVHGGLY